MQLPDSKFIACSYKDYLLASSNEIPERWLRGAGERLGRRMTGDRGRCDRGRQTDDRPLDRHNGIVKQIFNQKEIAFGLLH